jgi:hypothetical protein
MSSIEQVKAHARALGQLASRQHQQEGQLLGGAALHAFAARAAEAYLGGTVSSPPGLRALYVRTFLEEYADPRDDPPGEIP